MSICDKTYMLDNTNMRVILNFSSQSNYVGGLRSRKRERPRLCIFKKDKLDLKHFERCVLFHGTRKWHGLWVTKEYRSSNRKSISLERWTIFATKNAPQLRNFYYPNNWNKIVLNSK